MEEYRNAAIESARLLYQHLEQEGKGISVIRVVNVSETKGYFELILESHPKYLETIQVQIHNLVFSQTQIKPITYHSHRRILKVLPDAQHKMVFQNVLPENICIISDLKFLVKRVENWYMQYGGKLCLPQVYPSVSKICESQSSKALSEDQKAALYGILSSPFSYVWGAPGTGKTQYVLAQCVISYLNEGKRVLIAAPTNNAIEQTLRGVLSVLKASGTEYRGNILRLGVPSEEFAALYPDVCENAAFAKQVAAVSDEISALNTRLSELESISKRLPAYRQYCQQIEAFELCKDELPILAGQISEFHHQSADFNAQLQILRGESSVAEGRLKQVKAETRVSAKQIEEYRQKTEHYGNGWRRRLFYSKYAAYEAMLSAELETAHKLQEEENELICRIDVLNNKMTAIQINANQASAHLLEKMQEANHISAFWPELRKNVEATLHQEKITVNDIRRLLESYASKLKAAGAVFAGMPSEEELSAEKKTLSEQLQTQKEVKARLEKQGGCYNLAECNILAATVDTCMNRLPPNEETKFDHVFLDEAGYCPLIKGTTLTAYGCPVTLLGDHMQLPPVCEVGDDKLATERLRPVILWAQSTIFAEEALTQPPEAVFTGYLLHRAVDYRNMRKFDLLHTYRFGPDLAAVLAESVYARDFQGSDKHDTEIMYINATKIKNSSKRTSLTECRMILSYVQTHPNEEIGIITPYTNQKKEIKKILRDSHYPVDDVLTVHGSQGREWDTVLFSVTDTWDKWFTDSQNRKSQGIFVVNTAVSRAKKKLIIVCDYEYWIRQKSQLIGKLLSVAEPS